MESIIKTVVKKGWCKGCGVCVAICPKQRLTMSWNVHGYYQVDEDGSPCGKKCTLCYDICPAHGDRLNETELARYIYAGEPDTEYSKEAGYWRSSNVGYSSLHRLKGASGGMATWLLEKLFKTGQVDAVVAVTKTTEADKLFSFTICNSATEIRNCSRSAYYPVEISEVLRKIIKGDEKTYAVIGLPCVCKALRLAQQSLPVLKKRIAFIIGLVCGRQCSKFFAEYICALGGGEPHTLQQMIFRAKDLRQPANNTLMQFMYGDNQKQPKVGERLWWDGIDTAFSNSYFQPEGCFYCDDVFAECSDAVFMDAWLPQYTKYSEGHNLVVTRSIAIDELLNDHSGQLVLEKISLQEVIRSQQGVLDRKRIRRPAQEGEPRLREELFRSASFLQSKIIGLKRKMSFCSAESWYKDKEIAVLQGSCSYYLVQLKAYTKLLKIMNVSGRFIRKIYSTLRIK